MGDLADQLRRLGLAGAEEPRPNDVHRPRPPGGREISTANALILDLPTFGTVTSVFPDRGFGHVSVPGNSSAQFFHITAYHARRTAESLPPVGTPILFISGSDRRAPEKRRAVRWASLADEALSDRQPIEGQADLDASRRTLLDELTTNDIWGLLQADWYRRQWGGNPPADLIDQLLDEVLRARLSRMSATEMEAWHVRPALSRSPYAFAAGLLPDNAVSSFTDLLRLLSPEQLAVLGPPNIEWMRAAHPPARRALLQWMLLSQSRWPLRGDWIHWFQGREPYESDLSTWFARSTLPSTALTRGWVRALASRRALSPEQLEVLSDHSVANAVDLFDHLPEQRQDVYFGRWAADPSGLDESLRDNPARAVSIATCCALAIDLESDGEQVWQVGYARCGQATLLSNSSLESGKPTVAERIQSSRLLVGHNVLGWDWPILTRWLSISKVPLIWDTLLIQYLLDPGARSHSLGGSHRADQDALAAARLFEQQLRRLPASIARGLIIGEFETTAALVDAVVGAARTVVDYARKAPLDLLAAVESQKTVVLPVGRLKDCEWVPGATVVSVDHVSGLGAEHLQVDLNLLTQRLYDADCQPGPSARVLLAVAHHALSQGIALRRGMIPQWLVESDPNLRSAIDGSCVVPSDGQGWKIAPAPDRFDWWLNFDPDRFALVGLSTDVLILDRQRIGSVDFSRAHGAHAGATFARLVDPGRANVWLLADRAEQALEPGFGFTSFRTLRLSGRTSATPRNPRLGEPRPTLATRRHHVLHPGALDQAGYWSEVLRTFREVADPGIGRVPILLVISSGSRNLVDALSAALAELGLGELRLAHRSRVEHLQRAHKSGWAIVSTLSEWADWRQLARYADIQLQPVVEALPIEEWYACAETRAQEPTLRVDASEQLISIGHAQLREQSPSLLRTALSDWLIEVGLVGSARPTIIDSRLGGAIASELEDIAEQLLLSEVAFSSDEARNVSIALTRLQVQREEAPASYEAMEAFLVANWQPKSTQADRVTGFKQSQRTAMDAICARSANVLVCLPTGEGKSVLFQVPALSRGLRNRRLTLVLSPLKALMRDQVDRLREQGFAESADYLSGDRTTDEIAEVIQAVLDHRIVLLYVAPERLRSEVFLDVLHKRMVSDCGLEHVVVDEAHCVNHWGCEFRPDYFNALELLMRMCRSVEAAEPSPFILLSATITAADRWRLQALLSTDEIGSPLPLVVRPETFANPVRKHIAIGTRRVRGNLRDRRELDKTLAERLPLVEQAIESATTNRSQTGQRSAVVVFGSSRAHVELVAQLLGTKFPGRVDFYHAGLDTPTREEVYTRFRDGELDVLVATKAFGMGMDIPDIHWVVHLSPPAYLEDLLQEIGRIGRGLKERERAKLTKLSAQLAYSSLDFESLRSTRARNALSYPFISDLHRQMQERAHDLNGHRVAIVPTEGYELLEAVGHATAAAKRAKATRVRMALYWLERAKLVRLRGSIPDLFVIRTNLPTLQALSREAGASGELASLILKVGSAEPFPLRRTASTQVSAGAAPASSRGDPDSARSGPLLGRIFGLLGGLLTDLADRIGVMLGGAVPPATISAQPSSSPSGGFSGERTGSLESTIVLNLAQVRVHSAAFTSIGDVLAGLAELEMRGGLSLEREVTIAPRQLAEALPKTVRQLFAAVDQATVNLIDLASTSGNVAFNPLDLLADAHEAPGDNQEARRAFERAFINGLRCLSRAAGVRLRQVVRGGEKVEWEAVLTSSAHERANMRRRRIRRGAEALFGALRGIKSIPVARLIDELREATPDKRFRQADLRRASALLAAMNLLSVSPDLVPLSHVVELLPIDVALKERADIWEELRQINELAELRNLAMEVFSNIPTESQSAFIEGYFRSADAAVLRQFLDTQLGEILPDEALGGVSHVIEEMREKLRATKAVEFFGAFKRSEEPTQWEIAQRPFDQHLVVNAGPGAGKTSVLIGRIVHLIREQNVDPADIVVVAFNRAVVFEIRRRIRVLFRSLGYGSYAARLKVQTFHSLAVKSLSRFDRPPAETQDIDVVLGRFAERMGDAEFRRSVARGARAILVDEFQDATDQVYSVIRNLFLGTDSRAGVTVIGDDDQDILRWQRKQSKSAFQFSEEYFHRFVRDFAVPTINQFTLRINFRSARSIVDASQKMIRGFFEARTRSRRLKVENLMPRAIASDGHVERIPWPDSWDAAVDRCTMLLRESMARTSDSTAILCRSNAEVAEAHRRLEPIVQNLSVQGTATLRVADLRHVGVWLDYLRRNVARGDYALSDDLKAELFGHFKPLPVDEGVAHPGDAAVQLSTLWDLCCAEQPYPHLSSLVRFVEGLKTDDLTRLTGVLRPEAAVIVSTMHKVKGLEFDNVIVLPAAIPFGQGPDPDGDAAEEARLFYVGMTRAKNRLAYFVGARERSWASLKPERFSGRNATGSVLVGDMNEVSLSWSMRARGSEAHTAKCQSYIESEVAVGDFIFLSGNAAAGNRLMHRARSGASMQVGYLARSCGGGTEASSLKVSAVVRFRPKATDEGIAEFVRARGWGYVVLVSGRLR